MIRTFLFRILLGPAPVAPSEARMAEFDAAEDRTGNYGMHPSPYDVFVWDTEGRADRVKMGLAFCLTWRIAVYKLPRWCGYTTGKRTGIRLRRQPFMFLNPYRRRTFFGKPVRWS